jgi:hypothetical protein
VQYETFLVRSLSTPCDMWSVFVGD